MADEKTPVVDEPKRGPGRPPSPKSVPVSKELLELTRIGLAAAKMRRASPMLTSRGDITIPRKAQIKRLAADTGGQDGEFHWSHQDRLHSDRLAQDGYIPAIEPRTGDWANDQGDPLWKLPIDLWERHLAENSAISKAMLGERMKADAAKYPGEKVTKQKATGDNVVDVPTGADQL